MFSPLSNHVFRHHSFNCFFNIFAATICKCWGGSCFCVCW